MKKIVLINLLVCLSLSCINKDAQAGIVQRTPDCPVEGTEFIPHEDCTKYYICEHGTLIIMDCPETLFYNPSTRLCDYQYNVPECIDGTRPPIGGGTSTTSVLTTSSQESSPPPTTTPDPTTNTTPEPTSTTPEPTTSTTLEPKTSPTPEPTTSTTPEPITSTTSEPTTSTTILETTTKCSAEPSSTTPLPNGCPPSGISKIPNPLSCRSYFICINGLASEQTCVDGLLFNPVIKECDFPENVDTSQCTPTTTEPSTTTTTLPTSTTPIDSTEITITTPAPLPECPEHGLILLPYPGNCSLYLICADGLTVIETCAPGTCFDPDSGHCRPNPSFQAYEFKMFLECQAVDYYAHFPGTLYVPSAESCDKYVACAQGSYLATLECKKGFHFDFELQKCIRKEFSSCI